MKGDVFVLRQLDSQEPAGRRTQTLLDHIVFSFKFRLVFAHNINMGIWLGCNTKGAHTRPIAVGPKAIPPHCLIHMHAGLGQAYMYIHVQLGE